MALKKEKINGTQQGGSVKETSGMFKDSHSSGIKTTKALDGKPMNNIGGSPSVKKTDEPVTAKKFECEKYTKPTPHTFKR